MRALLRIAIIAVSGAALYYAGLLNSIIIQRPERPGAIVVVIAIGAALAAMPFALAGRGIDDARSAPVRVSAHRAVWLFVCVMAAVSLAWLWSMPRQHSEDWTPYHNDAIALNDCSARLLLAGQDPYATLNIFDCYSRFQIGADRTTPLRRGAFADVTIYPTDDQLDRTWVARERDGGNVEFVTRPSYPALSIVLLVPFVAWIWRDRVGGALAFGVACAIKQIAWFFAPFWLIAVGTIVGWRAAARQTLIAAAVFAVTNLPFIAWHPADWLAGVLTPVLAPMFPRGAGLVFLATNSGLPLFPSKFRAIAPGGRAA